MPASQPCPTCGKPVEMGKKFCEECGASVERAVPLSAIHQPLPTQSATTERRILPYALVAILGIALLAILGFVAYQFLIKSEVISSSGPVTPRTDLPLNHGAPVAAVAFLPDGKTLVSAGFGRLNFWELQSGKLLRTLTPGGNQYAAISPIGNFLATAHDTTEDAVDEDSVKVWDTQTGKLVRTFTGVRAVDILAFSMDGKALVIASNVSQRLKVWDVGTGELKLNFGEGEDIDSAHRSVDEADKIHSISFSPDGLTLAGGGDLLDIMTGKPKSRVEQDLGWMAYSPDGRILAGCRINGITLWDAQSLEMQTRLVECDKITSIAFSPDSKTLAGGCAESAGVKIWDVKTGQLKRSLPGYNKEVTSLAYSSDGKTLAGGSKDGLVRLWSMQD
jgi:WD40 repeat protein